MTLVYRSLFGAAALVATFASASSASAATNPCGNIELTAITECHFEASGGCKAKCEPLSFVASCDGECNASIETTCTGSCTADCSAECEVDPAAFECSASCKTSCEAQITADCQSDADPDGCISYCIAMCGSDCDAQCGVELPEADCNAQCNACCSGSCETEANFDCSLNCSAELQGGCEVQCDAPEGALFCDGQFLAVEDFPACGQWLLDNFTININFEVSASSSCAASPEPAKGGFAVVAGLAGLALLAARSRRRNSK